MMTTLASASKQGCSRCGLRPRVDVGAAFGGRRSRNQTLVFRAFLLALLWAVLLNLYSLSRSTAWSATTTTATTSSSSYLAEGVQRPTEYLQLYSDRPQYDVVALARAVHGREGGPPPNSTTPNTPKQVTAAICYKTLFGVVQLDHVMKWAAYHRLLGFQHIFMWYLPQVASYPYFEELQALPFVTLLENNDMKPVRMGRGPKGQIYDSMAGARNWTAKGAQLDLELRCLHQVATNYTWILFMDTDEYLWFDRPQGLQEFLKDHEAYFYLSLGKKMYTIAARPDRQPERTDRLLEGRDLSGSNSTEVGFGLDRFAFTASGYFCLPPRFNPNRKEGQSWWEHTQILLRYHFCRFMAREAEQWLEDLVWAPRWQSWFFGQDRWCYDEFDFRRGNPDCPLYRGRAKVMVKLEKFRGQSHSPVFIHGQFERRKMVDGRLHVDPHRAHFKEWPWIFHNQTLTQLRPPQDFVVTSNAEISVHDLETGLVPNRNGTWTFHYDTTLTRWFEYVAQRGL